MRHAPRQAPQGLALLRFRQCLLDFCRAGNGVGDPVRVARDGVTEGLVYMQVTRGVHERDFAFPPADTAPTVVMFTQAKNVSRNPLAEKGAAVVTVEDLRWKRRDIKSVALLAQVLAKQAAAEAGASGAFCQPIRLPHEVAPLFESWLEACYPDRAQKVLNGIRAMRGGKLYRSDWFERMRPQGEWGRLLRIRLAAAKRRTGLDRPHPVLRTDLFRPPARETDPRQGLLF